MYVHTYAHTTHTCILYTYENGKRKKNNNIHPVRGQSSHNIFIINLLHLETEPWVGMYVNEECLPSMHKVFKRQGLAMKPRMALNSPPSCLSLPTPGCLTISYRPHLSLMHSDYTSNTWTSKGNQRGRCEIIRNPMNTK